MIHELIEPKKKSVKSNRTKGVKNLGEFSTKVYSEPSDNENKGTGSASNTFIRPWLKNSLGLSQRNNQSHAISDQKSSRIVPRYKEGGTYESEGFNETTAPHSSLRVISDLDDFSRNRRHALDDLQTLDASSTNCLPENSANPFWTKTQNPSEFDSMCATSEMKLPKRQQLTLLVQKEANLPENESHKYKDDERRRPKSGKQRVRVKKHSSDQRPKEEADLLPGLKAQEFLEKGSKRDISPGCVSPGVNHLIFQGSKCRKDEPSDPSQQETNGQTDGKEVVETCRGETREGNLKDCVENSESPLKVNGGKVKKEDLKGSGEARLNSDKDSLRSTDEENDIKRFSEFLSKNKNLEEKRKCLEEVRNYFERKRRTRLTKRRCHEESKVPKCDDEFNFFAKKDDFPRERPAGKDVKTGLPAKEKKTKFLPCNEEVVEKAVSETLQKFMSLYHFHVSPTMMGSMRKNILEAIQSDSLESSPSKKNLVRYADHQQKPGSEPVKTGENHPTSRRENDRRNAGPKPLAVSEVDALVGFEPLGTTNCKDFKKTSFKTSVEGPKVVDQQLKSARENDVLENENFKRLKREFENCLKSVQFHADGTGLKIQSLVLEKEETCASKGIRFVYNFSKKSLEFMQLDCDQNKSRADRPHEKEPNKKTKDCETQTLPKADTTKKTAKSQTTNMGESRHQTLQTDEKPHATVAVQTEPEAPKDNSNQIKQLKDVDISPGLYRMVKSKDVGRFYLYPERDDEVKSKSLEPHLKCKHCNSQHTKTPAPRQILPNEIHPSHHEEKSAGKNKKPTGGDLSQSPENELHLQPKIDSSISCLFFRDSFRHSPWGRPGSAAEKKDNSPSIENDVTEPEVAGSDCKQHHLGCFWFWNGQRIGPGCDLKMHVEKLLKEKLDQINDRPSTFPGPDTPSEDTTSHSAHPGPVNVSDRDARPAPTSNPMFCFRRDDPHRVTVVSQCTSGQKTKTKRQSLASVEQPDVLRRDVGTQNCQNMFVSVNVSKMKSRSKTSTGSRMSGGRRKRCISSRGNHDSKGEVLGLKALTNLVKAVRELKKLQPEPEEAKDSSPESSFGTEGTTSSSASKNEVANSESSLLKRKMELEEAHERSRKANFEAPINESWGPMSDARLKETPMEKWGRDPEGPGYKHWQLVESVLNRVSLREREGLWADIREFIKKKIGRDINEEGAREVCIEIEQDMPKTGSGRQRRPVMARGHYIRNEGDVEVEIDLTLDDLEKILRQRHRKMRRRQIWNSNRAKKLFSSSSAQSGFTRKESRRYRPSSMDLL